MRVVRAVILLAILPSSPNCVDPPTGRTPHGVVRLVRQTLPSYHPLVVRHRESLALCQAQVLVNCLDGDGTLADGGGDPFHGAAAHVSGSEDARHARLHRQGGTFYVPSAVRIAVAREVPA